MRYRINISLLKSILPRLAFVAAALGLTGFTLWLDLFETGRDFLQKDAPVFSASGWVRSVLLACAATFAFMAIKPDQLWHRQAFWGDMPKWLAFGAAMVAALGMLTTIALLGTNPLLLNEMVREMQPAAIVAEAVLACAAIVFLLASIKACGVRAGNIGKIPTSIMVSAMFAVAFVILMEEQSWGQHMFGWQAGEAFSGNIQNETNFHNFYTYRFETAYYTVAFMLFVILPVAWRKSWAQKFPGIGFYVPPPVFAVIGFALCVYNYQYWNIVPLQLLFHLGVLVLAFVAIG